MVTRDQMYRASHREYHTLADTWQVLFPPQREDDQSILEHYPPSISRMLDYILREFTDGLDEAVAELIRASNPELDIPTAGWTITMAFVKDLAIRCYQLGQHLSKELPYEELTPCPRGVVTDDEIEQLLGG